MSNMPAEGWREVSRQRDLWLHDPSEKVCYFFPAKWVDEIPGVEPGEMYGYMPTGFGPESDIDTLFCREFAFDGCVEVTEDEARNLHPKLARHLDAINQE